MKKRSFALLWMLPFLLAGGALAEVCAGTTVAAETVAVAAEAGGTVDAAYVRAGEIVEAGAALARLRTTRVYAAEDGTVARILAEEGERIDGAVLELSPVSRYTIYCTVDGAYASPASTTVHIGETLRLRCTTDGTHRGTGTVTQIDGDEYTVEATGGEFYVGETVRLYRDAEFSGESRTGVGTVISADTQRYEGQGELVRLYVTQGEYVQRGELLYACAEDARTDLVASVAGIVVEAVAPGATLDAGQTAFVLAPVDQIEVEIQLEETDAARLRPGDAVDLIRADDPTETPFAGTVARISQIAQSERYAVRIRSEAIPPRLGLTVNVRFGETQ